MLPTDMEAERLRHITVTGGLDYLWNITSTMSGYDPERIFELIGSVGFNLAYTSNSEHKFQPGLNAGYREYGTSMISSVCISNRKSACIVISLSKEIWVSYRRM
ncbi:hypothetical protein BFINE_46740 [Bacteroides finegoldii DSM 17565]|nr:hypothetical protein BFINE_46740 [Bacteroides finegoldii DSM 17565]